MKLAFKYQFLLACQDEKLLKFIRDKIIIFLEEAPDYKNTETIYDISRLMVTVAWFHSHYKYNFSYSERLLKGLVLLMLYKHHPTTSLPNIKFIKENINKFLNSVNYSSVNLK